MSKKTENCTESGHDALTELRDVIGCNSCGLPTKRTQREMASEIADYCPSCVDKRGHLKPYDEVRERLVTKHYMERLGMERKAADAAATKKMAELPAWKDHK